MGHRSQGTAPNRTGASSVGQKVGRKASRMPVRQHVSCGCIECGLLKGQDTYCDVCSSAAHHTVRIHASHLPGAQNTAADALSRNRILEFLQVVPEAEREPTALPQSDRPDGQGTAQLDLTTLDQTVQQLLQAGLATSMQCSYMAGKRKFLSFCHDSNTSPLPLTEQKLSNFMAFEVNQGLRHQSAIRHMQIQWGDPRVTAMPRLELMLRGNRQACREGPGCQSRQSSSRN